MIAIITEAVKPILKLKLQQFGNCLYTCIRLKLLRGFIFLLITAMIITMFNINKTKRSRRFRIFFAISLGLVFLILLSYTFLVYLPLNQEADTLLKGLRSKQSRVFTGKSEYKTEFQRISSGFNLLQQPSYFHGGNGRIVKSWSVYDWKTGFEWRLKVNYLPGYYKEVFDRQLTNEDVDRIVQHFKSLNIEVIEMNQSIYGHTIDFQNLNSCFDLQLNSHNRMYESDEPFYSIRIGEPERLCN